MNTMLSIYKELFGRDDEEIQAIIVDVQTVCREYVSQYTNPPLPLTDDTLDKAINTELGFNPAIELNETLREGIINLLVNHHDLQVLKPWGPDPSDKLLMIW